MSAFAGVYLRANRGPDFLRAATDALSAALSRSTPEAEFDRVEISNAVIFKFDPGAFGDPGVRSEGVNSASALAGHPFVEGCLGAPRLRHLEHLEAVARHGSFSALRNARGSYSFVFVDAISNRLVLGTDALGVRPLYYVDDSELVVFSSTLAPFRSLDRRLTGGVDERGAVELAVLGFPLADRTELLRVKCLSAGSVVIFDAKRFERVEYWNMSTLKQVREYAEPESLRHIWDVFNDAVAIRLGRDSVAMAMLSGGMDSRVVVAALRQLGVGVNSLNFAPPDSQDLVYGRRMAAALGCTHTEVPIEAGSVVDRTKLAVSRWRTAEAVRQRPAERPKLVWSGDGGSVALGHVYLSEAMVAAAEAGEFESAIDSLLWDQRWIVPRRVLRPKRAREISAYPKEGLLEALGRVHSADPGRRLHMLLMATDQRRHMHPHFESIYNHECEMQLPFFDLRFIEAVLGLPARPFVNHRFYNKWMQLFPAEVMAAPWQAYPGHEECPIRADNQLMYQWTTEFSSSVHQRDRRRYLNSVRQHLMRRAFAGTAVSPARLTWAWAATALRIRDLTYALRFSTIVSDPSAV